MTISTEYYRVIRRNPSLIAYWRLNETSGVLAADRARKYEVSGTYNGSPSNGPPIIYASGAETETLFPGSKQFGTSGQNVEIPNATPLRIVSDIAIEMWIIPKSLKSTCNLLNKMNSTSSPTHSAPYSLGLLAGAVSFQLGNGTTQVSLNTTTVLPVGIPVHIVATCFKKTMNVFINGIQSGSANLGSQEDKDLEKPIYIGAYPNNTERFNGLISEVALYNGALSASTAKEHFSIGKRLIFKKPYYTTYDVPSYSEE